ncbi:MAG: hypothetical protein FJ137_16445 [Deltaproteobacteria bacterium]|nr:hypothetical protein [Deltaproteobacteria bacterium]
MSVRKLQINGGARVRIATDGGPVAFVAGEILIAGTLDVSCSFREPLPGDPPAPPQPVAGPGAMGWVEDAGGASATMLGGDFTLDGGAGGGGGGHTVRGGRGAAAAALLASMFTAGAGGQAAGFADLHDLVGGAPGGDGLFFTTGSGERAAPGLPGGGALYLGAFADNGSTGTITLAGNAALLAEGCNTTAPVGEDATGGAGAGGSLFLEAERGVVRLGTGAVQLSVKGGGNSAGEQSTGPSPGAGGNRDVEANESTVAGEGGEGSPGRVRIVTGTPLSFDQQRQLAELVRPAPTGSAACASLITFGRSRGRSDEAPRRDSSISQYDLSDPFIGELNTGTAVESLGDSCLVSTQFSSASDLTGAIVEVLMATTDTRDFLDLHNRCAQHNTIESCVSAVNDAPTMQCAWYATPAVCLPQSVDGALVQEVGEARFGEAFAAAPNASGWRVAVSVRPTEPLRRAMVLVFDVSDAQAVIVDTIYAPDDAHGFGAKLVGNRDLSVLVVGEAGRAHVYMLDDNGTQPPRYRAGGPLFAGRRTALYALAVDGNANSGTQIAWAAGPTAPGEATALGAGIGISTVTTDELVETLPELPPGAGPSLDDTHAEAIALLGDVLVVGVPGDDSCGNDSGATWRYQHTGERWRLVGTVPAWDPGPGLRFGAALAIASGGLAVLSGADVVHDGQTRVTNYADDADDEPTRFFAEVITPPFFGGQPLDPLTRNSISLDLEGGALCIGAPTGRPPGVANSTPPAGVAFSLPSLR